MGSCRSYLTQSLLILCVLAICLKRGQSDDGKGSGNGNGNGNGKGNGNGNGNGHGNGNGNKQEHGQNDVNDKDLEDHLKKDHTEDKKEQKEKYRFSKSDEELADMFSPELMDDGKDFKFKNNSEILDSPPDDDDEWEQTRPLPRSKQLIHAYMKMHEVVPDIIPRAPQAAIEVTYGDSVCIDFGNELTEDQVRTMPHKTVWPVEKGAYYTLVFFSPDYPSRINQSESEYVYWFVANIHDTCVPATGVTFTEYLSPTALADKSALHRFIYLVYKQPEGIVSYRMPFTTKYYYDSRKHFNVSEFALDYNLGVPVAGNFFQMVTVKEKKDSKNKKH